MSASKKSKSIKASLHILALVASILPIGVEAGILVQTNSGTWVDVNGFHFSYGAQVMPNIVIEPGTRNSSFMMQRAMAWGNYRRPHSATGFMLVDPSGNGALSAATPRQAAVRSHVARANAYRLEYFGKR